MIIQHCLHVRNDEVKVKQMVHVSPSQYNILPNPQVELYVPDVSTQRLPKRGPWVPMTQGHSLLSVVAVTWRQCPVCVSQDAIQTLLVHQGEV